MSKKKTKVTGKPEHIVWLDHCSFTTNDWHSTPEELIPLEVITIGWVVKETKKYVIVASTFTEHNQTLGEMCIIKGCIISRKKLSG